MKKIDYIDLLTNEGTFRVYGRDILDLQYSITTEKYDEPFELEGVDFNIISNLLLVCNENNIINLDNENDFDEKYKINQIEILNKSGEIIDAYIDNPTQNNINALGDDDRLFITATNNY